MEKTLREAAADLLETMGNYTFPSTILTRMIDLRAALDREADRPDAEKALEDLVGLVGATVMNDSTGPVLHINFDWGDSVSEWIWITHYPNLAKWLKSRGAE